MKTIREDQQVLSKVQDLKCNHSRTVQLRTMDCPVAHRIARCHTADCPVHQGTVAQRLVPIGIVEENH
jgi:hypothetical protein